MRRRKVLRIYREKRRNKKYTSIIKDKYILIENSRHKITKNKNTFIDLFAGCGGLSIGLMKAGWEGLFAVEKEKNAFHTLKYNLIEGPADLKYDWPTHWLPPKNYTIREIIGKHSNNLKLLRGSVDLIAGGPPCQGFSFAGRRRKTDPRNKLFKEYLEFVKIVLPKIIVIENVSGISVGFGKKNNNGYMLVNGKSKVKSNSYADIIINALGEIGYYVYPSHVKAFEYGVPQLRPRFILIGIRQPVPKMLLEFNLLNRLKYKRELFLTSKGLDIENPVTAKKAISDLETTGKKREVCPDSPGYDQLVYNGPIPGEAYQLLMHGSMNGRSPNSMRLVKHRESTIDRFHSIQKICRPGTSLSDKERALLGIGKRCIVKLDPNKPSHTLTTLPDDILHYSEPRILTVRECARLQSFPDWFEFKGVYTTGGDRRAHTCPRYTQVGNAVPPLLAEIIGLVLKDINNVL